VREFQKWQDPLMSCTKAPLAKKRSFDAYATRPTRGRLKRNVKVGRYVEGVTREISSSSFTTSTFSFVLWYSIRINLF
jgi:hypothetical protein